jgi:hypothetical protein
MKVPAVKRYRTEIKKRQPKMSFNKAFGRFAAVGAGVAIGTAAYYGLGFGKKDQNMRIEMQKISKEKWGGKKFTRKEISARLKKAKQSKREFTWV